MLYGLSLGSCGAQFALWPPRTVLLPLGLKRHAAY